MIAADLQTVAYASILALVAGTPLIFAACSCTPFQKRVVRFLPLATVPALLAPFTVPVDMVVEVPWFFMGGRMGLDQTGRIFLSLSALIWFLASFSSRRILKNDTGQRQFHVFFLTAMTGNFGLILASGMLGYYLFFALMSFAAYGLVVHKATDNALQAGRIYLTLVMIGEVALFTALILLVHNTGGLAIEDIAGISYQPLTLILLFIGFGVKIGALPLHGWMTSAYQETPIPAAAVLAGAMVNAGILGWLRFLPLGQTSCPTAAVLFIAVGAVAALYGVIIGLKCRQAGAVLGASSISQMGLITVIFGLGLFDHKAGFHAAPVLMVYVVHHSLAKSSLFFGYDLVERQGKILSHLQIAAILLPALGLAGLPFTSGAIAKTAFKDLTATLGNPWYGLGTFFLPLTATTTTMLMLHFIRILKYGTGTGNPAGKRESGTIFTVSVIATGAILWLWPASRDSAILSLAGMTLLQSLWPVTAGFLLYLVWSPIFSAKKGLPDDHKKQTLFDLILETVARILKGIEWPQSRQDVLFTHLYRIVPQLRRSEKIMGRWKVIGISYLALCLCLLFLLL